MTSAINVISLGAQQPVVLSASALAALQDAEVIIGAQHHFDWLADFKLSARQILFPSPFNALRVELEKYDSKRLVVLASGDALFYGVGDFLLRCVDRERLCFHANISAIQAAFHRVGLSWQDAIVQSLHGRPLETLKLNLQSGNKLGLFTDEASTPQAIAQLLCEEGFSDSQLWVCEALGKAEEVVGQYSASDLQTEKKTFHPLNICIVQCVGNNPALQRLPGLSDDAFATGREAGKGMISKREVRLAILALMQPRHNEIAWDVGAGCGSVSIEWARQNPSGQIYAIENNSERMEYLTQNNQRFGTRLNVTPIEATAPQGCDNLPVPDVVFIGGSGGELDSLLGYCWQKLQSGGKLIASAVTEGSEKVLLDFVAKHNDCEGEVVKLQVSKTANLASAGELTELKPVTLIKVVKSQQALH